MDGNTMLDKLLPRNGNEDTTLADNVVLTYVFPILGIILSNALYLSPLLAIIRAKDGGILPKNIHPFMSVSMFLNCSCWIVYGLVAGDLFVFWSNWSGCLLGVFYFLIMFPLLSVASQRRMTYFFLACNAIFLLASMISFITLGHDPTNANLDVLYGTRQLFSGIVANVVLTVFYLSPMNAMVRAISERNSIYLHWPFATLTTMNGMFWIGYAIAKSDIFILIPNFVGSSVGIMQLLLLAIFPRLQEEKARITDPEKSATERSVSEIVNQSDEHVTIDLPKSEPKAKAVQEDMKGDEVMSKRLSL